MISNLPKFRRFFWFFTFEITNCDLKSLAGQTKLRLVADLKSNRFAGRRWLFGEFLKLVENDHEVFVVSG